MFGVESLKAKKALAYPIVLGSLMMGGYLPAAARGQSERKTKVPDELIFVSNRTGNYQIYLKNLVTKKLVNLSQSESNDMNPQVSPNGKEIVFYSDREGNNQIYEMEIDQPGEVTRLTRDDSDAYDPVFMPDGRILYKSDLIGDKGLGDIWIMDADGSNARDLTPDTPHTEQWKPEPISNHEIVYTTRFKHGKPNSDELFHLSLKSGVSTRLTKNNIPDWYPAYSPAAKKMAFISKPNPGKKTPDAIYTMDTNGKKRSRLTHLKGDSDDPSWSQDGKYITFLNNKNGNYSVYVMTSKGKDIRQLDISPSGDDLSPVFVPQN